MRLTIRKNGQSKSWVARTIRGFNRKQRKEILEFRKQCGLVKQVSK
jgi:hypothetical protein